MRYTRAGKSTHQRVAQEATPWEDLKSSSEDQSQRFQKKTWGKKGNDFRKDRPKNNFRERKGNKKEEDQSANFVKLGERVKPGEKPKNQNATGQVQIFGKFWVPAEDAKRLKALSKQLKEQGLTRNEVWNALLNERRKAEKVARRARNKVCFNCRQFGHVLMDCPQREGDKHKLTLEDEICFKCGSTEHLSRECKKAADKFEFAKCFICSKSGHIARQCPENTKGVYPAGGCCKLCQEITHLAKDCPTLSKDKQETEDNAVIPRMSDNVFASIEYEGDILKKSEGEASGSGSPKKPKRRVVKMS